MKNEELYLSELKEIRQIMEQSSRFLSLSGLAGVLIGLYAIAGAFIAYQTIYTNADSAFARLFAGNDQNSLTLFGGLILALSLITILWLTARRVKKSGKKFWNPGTKLMTVNLAIPLISGGIFILVFISQGIVSVAAPSCLVFYGLALVNAAKFTRQEIFYMGLFQIVLGIFAAIFPNWGLLFWAIGFGLLHIIYGSFMYFKYEHNSVSA